MWTKRFLRSICSCTCLGDFYSFIWIILVLVLSSPHHSSATPVHGLVAGQNQSYFDLDLHQSSGVGPLIGIRHTVPGEETIHISGLDMGGIVFQASNGWTTSLFDSTQGTQEEAAFWGHGPEALGLGALCIQEAWTQQVDKLRLVITLTSVDTVHLTHEVALRLNGPGDSDFYAINSHSLALMNEELTRGDGFTLQNGVLLSGSWGQLAITVTNPYDGDFIRRDGDLHLRVLRTTPARSADQTVDVHSILAPGDTIQRVCDFWLDPPNGSILQTNRIIALPSPHPDAADGVLTFLGDDIPLRSFSPLTDTNNPDPLMAALAELMLQNPDIRLSFVIIFDKLVALYTMNDSKMDGWSANAGNLAYVPFHHNSGDRSLRMEVNSDTSCWVQQSITTPDDGVLDFSAYIRIPEQLNPDGGFYIRLLTRDGLEFEHSDFYSNPTEWTNIHWTPFTQVQRGDRLILRMELHHGGGSAFIDDVRCTIGGTDNIVRNPGFETGETSLSYDSSGYKWWMAHGPNRLTNAPEAYLENLRQLDRREVVYGYEDRIGLGLHGYHHTVTGSFIGLPAEWEMMYDDPYAHKMFFDAMLRDAVLLGLHSKNLRALRTPGFYYDQSTVLEAMRHGVIWLSENEGLGSSFYPVYSENKMLFMHRLTFWGDNPDSGWSKLILTKKALDQGGAAQWGWHPGGGLNDGDPARMAWYNQMFQTIRDDYPHARWEFAEDIAERGIILSEWRGFQQFLVGDTLAIEWRGAVLDNMSLLLFKNDNQVVNKAWLLDTGEELPIVMRQNCSFVLLPELSDTLHRVVINTIELSGPQKRTTPALLESPVLKVWPVPTNACTNVNWEQNSRIGELEIVLFNILGEAVIEQRWHSNALLINRSIDLNGLSTGLYLLRVSNPETHEVRTRKVVLLR
ncbi:MAG: T9SS type A sorting domain-containing protein [bacterium]